MSLILDKTLNAYNYYETVVLTDSKVCSKKLKNASKLKIFNMNIRSLTHNFDEFFILVNSLKEAELDLIVLTETFQLQCLNNFNIQNYNIHYNYGKINRNDGVVVYIKTNISANVEVVNHLNTNILRITLEKDNMKYGLSAIYRSHDIPTHTFLSDLNNYLSLCKERNEIFLGDINIDILSTTQESLDYLNVMSEFGFISFINTYTREVGNSKSCLDHIFLKTLQNMDSITGIVLKTTITDHYATILAICDTNSRKVNLQNTTIAKFNKNKFKIAVSSQSWNQIMNQNDPNLACETFIEILQSCQNLATTITKINSKNKKRKSWITMGIINSINKRNKLKQQVLRDPTNQQLLDYYKRYRNLLNTCIKNTKATFYKTAILKAPKDTKHLWNTVRDSINNNFKKKESIDMVLGNNGEKLNKITDIVNEFNIFFGNVGKNLAQDITRRNVAAERSCKTIENNCPNTLFLYPVSRDEILDTISSLRNSKSNGIDNISVESLKSSRDDIALPLQYICNLIFETGTFPNKLKTSLITPVHKSGSRDKVNNYRPIALLSNLSKIFEKCIKNRVLNFLEKNNLIFSNQYGFREKRSAEDAINNLTSKLYAAIDQGCASAAVFLDLAKAFDTVSHKILLQKIEKLGIRGNGYKLIESYLQNRTQQVKYQSVCSNILPNEWGVPQGSVLGPILFLIYINDLSTLSNDCQIISYADDTVIYFTANTWLQLYFKISKKLKEVKNWLDGNLLTLNIEKTKCVPFVSYTTHLPQYTSITIHGTNNSISVTQNIKYLGLTIDSHLKWDVHILQVCGKIRKLFYLFKIIRQYLDSYQLKTIYYALVQSLLVYGISGWGGINKSNLKPLEITHKTILKIMYSKPVLYPSDLLFQESNILNIRQLYIKKLTISVHLQNKLFVVHNYSTRSTSKQILITSTARKTIGTRCYTFLANRFYNMLPNTLKSIKSATHFKKQLDKFLITNNLTIFYNLLESTQITLWVG